MRRINRIGSTEQDGWDFGFIHTVSHGVERTIHAATTIPDWGMDGFDFRDQLPWIIVQNPMGWS